MNSYIAIGEAAKILGKGKRTLMRWDEMGKLKAQREQVSNIRIYDRAVIEKIARWFDLRRREKEHLRKLPAINAAISKFIFLTPRFGQIPPSNGEEMKKAFEAKREWERVHKGHQKEYLEFTEGFYGGLTE